MQQQLSLSGTNVSVDNGTCKQYQKTVEEKMEKVSKKKKKAFLPVTVSLKGTCDAELGNAHSLSASMGKTRIARICKFKPLIS